MRAIRFHRIGSADVLAIEDVSDPVPGPNDVRVDVRAIGINYADVHFRKGEYFIKPVLPDTPGFEAAGVIESVGSEVKDLRVGMRVALTGAHAYAERIITPAYKVYPMPDDLSFEDAASLVVQGLTALFVLDRSAHMQRGESVLVHAAAGGVGSLAVQLAKIRGASLVIGTTGSESKISVLNDLGCDVAIAGADFTHAVRRAAPKGVDVILEMLGGTASYQRNLACLAPEGRMVVFGAASGDTRGTVAPIGLMAKNHTITGFYITPLVEKQQLCATAFAELADLVVKKHLRILRHRTLPLEEAAAAHKMLESRTTVGKIVLVP